LPFSILPTLVFIFFRNKKYKALDFLLPVSFILLFFGSWLIAQYLINPHLAYSHIIWGTRRASLHNDFLRSFNLYINYLHNGIGRWFYPGIIGLIVGLLSFKK